MGDFNAKDGNGQFEEFIGPFGLVEWKEREEPRRPFTWKSPQDTSDHIVRHQIGLQKVPELITSAKTHPGVDIQSVHNLILGTIKLKLKKLQQTETKKHDIRHLKKNRTKQSTQQYIKEHLNTGEHISNIEELGKLHTITQDI